MNSGRMIWSDVAAPASQDPGPGVAEFRFGSIGCQTVVSKHGAAEYR